MAKRIVGTTPRQDGYRMPGEFEEQDRRVDAVAPAARQLAGRGQARPAGLLPTWPGPSPGSSR